MSAQSYSCFLKVIFVGDSGVGKTCFLNQHFQKNIKNVMTTFGITPMFENISLKKKNIKINYIDTSGLDCYSNLIQNNYNDSSFAFLVFDLTNKDSFDNIEKWLNALNKRSSHNIAKILIGNKCDLENKRTVTTEQAQELALKYGMTFFETSSITGKNIQNAIDCCLPLAQGKYIN